MRDIDTKAVSLGLSIYLMMENAGNSLARYMLQGLGFDLSRKKIVTVCGLSNNSGGGIASARHLEYYGADVTVVLLGTPEKIKTPDAKLQWRTIANMNSISKICVSNDKEMRKAEKEITIADGVIDAIFGTGFSGKKIGEPASRTIDCINASNAYIVSNDIPSGIDADTGNFTDKAVSPDVTVVLHSMKAGIRKIDGRSIVVSIGIPLDAEEE